MFKNATFLSFYFADNQLFSNSETLVIYRILFVLILKSGHIVSLESILLPKIDYF